MTHPPAPRLAVALLQRFSTDPALVGDLLEEYETGRSRLWLWRQVAVTLALVLRGRAHEPAPHRAKTINLATTPKGSAVGGLGLVAIVVFVALVSPQAWWLLGVGLGGGALLGAVMIHRSRRRQRRRPPPPRTGMLLAGLVLLGAPVMHAAQTGQPAVQVVRQIPRADHRPMRMEDQVDAILWNGNQPPKPILLSAATCADPAYLPIRLARIALGGCHRARRRP